MANRAPVTAVGLSLLAILACTQDNAGEKGAGASARRDSAGIEIVETAARTLQELPVWKIAATPLLEVGSSDSGALLDRIAGAVRFPGGVVAIADASQEIRFVDASGAVVRRAGRRGEGPGEFERITFVLPHDSGFLVGDRDAQRATIFREDGSVVEMRRMAIEGCRPRMSHGVGYLCWPAAAFWNGAVVTTQALGGARPSAVPNRTSPPVVSRDLWTFVGIARDGSLLEVDSIRQATEVLFRDEYGIPTRMIAPFSPAGSWAVGRNRIALGDGDRFEIRFRTDDGRHVRTVRVLGAATPVTREMLAGYEKTATDRTVLSAAGVPDSLPSFTALRLDDVDRLWAATHTGWVVFDSTGVPRARVPNMPPGFRLLQIGRDFVLGVLRDTMHVERVSVFALEGG